MSCLVSKEAKCYGVIGEMRGGSLSNRRHTVMVRSAVFCVAFVVLFGGARMPAWMQQGDVSIFSTEPT
jgi:hypothetical protein